MKVTFRVRRLAPGGKGGPWWQDYPVDANAGLAVLSALYRIQDEVDGTLAFRYACRGAICGSCAMRINGVAALACKTQVSSIAGEGGTVVLEPLLNMPVIKDLVVDQGPFFLEMRKTCPWLLNVRRRTPDEPLDYSAGKSVQELDEWRRSAYCIMCQACFSDCPKRLKDPSFIGPEACVEIFKHVCDPREADIAGRLARAASNGGVFDCDKHGVCVKVCPKDVRPMRAILFLQDRIKGTQGRPGG